MDLIPDNALIKCKSQRDGSISYKVFQRISKEVSMVGENYTWHMAKCFNFISYVNIIEDE